MATVLTMVAALVLAEQALHEAAEQTVIQELAGPIAASAASGRRYCCSGSSVKECCTDAGACCVVSCSRSCWACMGYCTFCSHRNSSAWLGRRAISAPNKVAVQSDVDTWWAPHTAQIHLSVAPPANSCGLSSCNARCPHSVQLGSIDGADLGFSPRAAQEKRGILNISSLHTLLRLLTQPPQSWVNAWRSSNVPASASAFSAARSLGATGVRRAQAPGTTTTRREGLAERPMSSLALLVTARNARP